MEPAQEKEKSWRIHLPVWMRDLAMKILPWLLMGIVSASIGLYVDNVGNKRDISRNGWRNDQQDARLDRIESRLERIEDHVSTKAKEDDEFQNEVLDRLRKLLSGKR